jgi:hypothetical protein
MIPCCIKTDFCHNSLAHPIARFANAMKCEMISPPITGNFPFRQSSSADSPVDTLSSSALADDTEGDPSRKFLTQQPSMIP